MLHCFNAVMRLLEQILWQKSKNLLHLDVDYFLYLRHAMTECVFFVALGSKTCRWMRCAACLLYIPKKKNNSKTQTTLPQWLPGGGGLKQSIPVSSPRIIRRPTVCSCMSCSHSVLQRCDIPPLFFPLKKKKTK